MNSEASTGKSQIFKVRFLGTGNAFAHEGRGYQCIHVSTDDMTFLVDCGPTVQLIAEQMNVDLCTLDAIFLTHIHGDHALGLPFILLQMEFIGDRTRPLILIVPRGEEEYADRSLRMAFPDVHRRGLHFPLDIRTLDPADGVVDVESLTVQAFPMEHSVPVNGLRFVKDGAILAISGDTTPCQSVFDLEQDADLFIVECSAKNQHPELPHISHEELLEIAPSFTAKRVVVVHTDGLFDPHPFLAPVDGDLIDVP
jgi:ribonuclease BN (tRNA processing enzyme)